MRTVIFSDLHSNLEATRAVLASARSHSFDAAVVLGDLVGYGASPAEVIEAVRELNPVALVRGNHDKVVAGIDDGEGFNPVALESARINRGLLRPGQREFLTAMPRGPFPVGGGFWIAHGSPADEDEYLVEERQAAWIFEQSDFRICFFGHTHVAGAFVLKEGRVERFLPRGAQTTLLLKPEARYLINPGSVGQPRDEDPRASYAIYDEAAGETVFHRVDYPIPSAQERMRRLGLPSVLAERLAWGV
ncbi:MAG TPA: metallophosphoesterase family protein [Candidatus Polarisedimenticolia bacterium]|jgi:predicted phosphodiesterase|nr:metallophosphoesterase family protein [Candidatus Polarisedimenticolia bacterium]